MNKWFKRLHDRREPHGIETKALKAMPAVLMAGTMVPVLVSIFTRIWLAGSPGMDVAKQIMTTDIFIFATVVTFWTAVLAVSIAWLIVFVMKGPAYVADAYPLNEAPHFPLEKNR